MDSVVKWILPGLARNPDAVLPTRLDQGSADRGSINLMYSCPDRLSWSENFERAMFFPDSDIRGNPHMWQRLCDPLSQKLPALSIPLDRCLSPFALRRVYRRRHTDTIKSVVHWGQRKLLMSEIEFLTEYTTNACETTVIYVGAGPGNHLPVLMDLFRDRVCQWVLFDKTPFAFDDAENTVIHNRYFGDDDAHFYSGKYKRLLFICDIRNLSHGQYDAAASEAAVTDDMEQQARWVTILGACKSMLKFRLPYIPGTSTYLKGQLRLPVWGPQTTTEVRLIVDDDLGVASYDHQKHWEQMFYFNTVTRVMTYANDISTREDRMRIGLCSCYDCTSELHILKSYLITISSPEDVLSLSCRISSALGKFCSRKSLLDLS